MDTIKEFEGVEVTLQHEKDKEQHYLDKKRRAFEQKEKELISLHDFCNTEAGKQDEKIKSLKLRIIGSEEDIKELKFTIVKYQ